MIFKHLSEKYWGYYDELKRLRDACPSQEGKAIYRRGQLMWKTKALIVEDNMLALRGITPTTGDVIPDWTNDELSRLHSVLTKIFGVGQ